MQIITNLEQIKQLAEQRLDEFEVMHYMLVRDDDVDDKVLDAIVDRIAQPIIDTIDCKECANCCSTLDVYLTSEDAQRLSEVIDLRVTDIIDIESAKLVDEWGKFKQSPCRLLNGKLCSIYEHRPESCRIYPVFTPDFRWTLKDTIKGAGLCPIVYNVLSELVENVSSILFD